MIYHNRYLTITDVPEMGQYTFDSLEGWEDFAAKAALRVQRQHRQERVAVFKPTHGSARSALSLRPRSKILAALGVEEETYYDAIQRHLTKHITLIGN